MKKIQTILITILCILFTTSHVWAEKPKIPYSVSAILPDNQIDPNKNYFDLRIEPGTTQEILLSVKNLADTEIEINIIPQNGTTTTGNIDYTGAGELLENTIQYRFTDICSPKQNIHLQSKEERDIVFTLAMPPHSFEGIILGGFQIYEVLEETFLTDAKEENSGFICIENRFEQIIGVILRESEEELLPEFRLGKIEPSSWNARFALTCDLELLSPTLVEGFGLTGKVISHKNNNIVLQFKKDRFSMAPNSLYRFSENIHPDELPAGKYTMQLSISEDITSESGNDWYLEKEFTITRAQKQEIIAITLEGQNHSRILILSICCAILLLIIIIIAINHTLRKKRRAKINVEFSKGKLSH